MDMEVAALHRGFLRGVKRSGGLLVCGGRVERLDHPDGHWRIAVGHAVIEGRIIVNAAGAQDAQPDELDLALLAVWLQRGTLLTVTRIGRIAGPACALSWPTRRQSRTSTPSRRISSSLPDRGATAS